MTISTRSTRRLQMTRTPDTPRWWRPVGLSALTVAACLTGTLLAIAPSSASPTWPAPDSGGGTGVVTTDPPTRAPCFTRPLHWSIALDGSLPTCSRPPGNDTLQAMDLSKSVTADTTTARLLTYGHHDQATRG